MSAVPRKHHLHARVRAWMVCALAALGFALIAPALTPTVAQAGSFTQPGGSVDNGNLWFSQGGIGIKTRLAGNETTDPIAAVTYPPYADLTLCIFFGAGSTWNTMAWRRQFNGSSWPGTLEQQETKLITPCLIGFSWSFNAVVDGDSSAGGINPWQLRTTIQTNHNLIATYWNGTSWNDEVLPNMAGDMWGGRISADGTDVGVVASHNDTTLASYRRTGTNAWTNLGGPNVGSPTWARGDIAWVGGEPWVVSAQKVGNGKLYVHRYTAGSWATVGANPLSINTGSGDVTDVAIANDASDHPYISWVEDGSVHVKQWNGTSWVVIGGGPVGTGTSTDITVNDRIDKPYVTWAGTTAGHGMKWWDGTTWRTAPVAGTETSTTSSITIAKGQPWIGGNDGNLYARGHRFNTTPPNAPTVGAGPATLSTDNTPVLDLSGTWSGDPLGVYYANRWQVRLQSSPATYTSIAWDSGNAPTGTSITTAALADGVYCYRVAWADHQTTYGAWSGERCGWTIDTTPPPVPATRNDGTAADIAWNNSATQISGNWSVSTDAMSGTVNYDYCVSTSSSGADCAGAATIPWTVTTSTTMTRSGLSLTEGTRYYVCVRARDNAGLISAAGCSNGQNIDSINPTAPTLVSPADIGYVLASPTLTSTFNDVLPGSPGQMSYQLCTVSNCSSTVQTGSSLAALAVGANGSWTPTALTTGLYYWRARSTDSASNVGPYSAIQSFTVNYVPSAPTALTPTGGTWINTVTPTFQAQYVDPGDTGSIRFEICTSNAAQPWSTNCGASYRTVDTNTGIINGALAAAQFNTDLTDGTYYWKARNVDSYGELSGWTAPITISVDTTTPTVPLVQSVRPSGAGKITLTYGASTDSGSGTVRYNVAYSTNQGGSWTTACSNTTATSCEATGIANLTPVLMRVQACDLALNCTVWQSGAGATGQPYYPRTNVASTLLTTAANVQAATATAGTDNSTTRIRYVTGWSTSTPGYYTVQPNANNTTRLASAPTAPINTNPGRGWVIDNVAGKSVAAGDLTVEFTTDTGNGGADNGTVECRAYVLTTSAGVNITASTPIGVPSIAVGVGGTSGTDVINGASGSTWSCAPGELPAQIALSSNQAIYVELVVRTTSSVYNWNDEFVMFHMNGTQSAITIPGNGTFPNAPSATFSPASGAITNLTPTLQSRYTHPTPVNGTVVYDVATDAAFTNIVQTGASAQVANNASASFALSTLLPGTQYYWRARAVDNVGLLSGMSATQTFTTSTAPAAPTNTSPPGSAIVRSATPTLTASAFSDPDGGDSHSRAQWQVRTQFGAYSNAVDNTTSATDLTSHVVTPALTNNTTYCWHVRYRDSYSVWGPYSPDTCFRYDSSGGTLTVSVDAPSVSLPTLSVNADVVGTSVVTVSSLNMTGYTLNATDASDTTSLTGAGNVPDWTGTNATPTTWTSGTGPYFGVTVLGVAGTTTTKDTKWGSGILANDFVNNKYAGLRNTSSVALHNRATFSVVPDIITMSYRLNAGNTAAGNYASNVTVVAVPNP